MSPPSTSFSGEQPRALRIYLVAAGLPAGRPLAVRAFWESGAAQPACGSVDIDLARHTCQVQLFAPA